MLKKTLQAEEKKIIKLEREIEQFFIREVKLNDAMVDSDHVISNLKLQDSIASHQSTIIECGSECEMAKELADQRLSELNLLSVKFNALQMEAMENKCKLEILPRDVVEQSSSYKELQNTVKLMQDQRDEVLNELNEQKRLFQQHKEVTNFELDQIKKADRSQVLELTIKVSELECQNRQLEAEKNNSQTEINALKSVIDSLQHRIEKYINPIEDSYQNHIQRLKDEIQRMKECVTKEKLVRDRLQNCVISKIDNWSSSDCAGDKRILALEEIIKSVRSEISAAAENEIVLAKELELTGIAYEELFEKTRQINTLLTEKEKASIHLLGENIEHKRCIGVLKNESKSLLEEYRLSMIHEIEMLKKETAEQSNQISEMKFYQAELEAKLHACYENEQNFQSALAEVTAHHRHMLESNEQREGKLLELETMLYRYQADLEQSQFRERRLIEEKLALQEQCKHYISSKERRRILRDRKDLELLKFEVHDIRESMKCSGCHVRKMDTVISKCYHVFCAECIKARIETRQRMCPKCNAKFGANDIHRIFLYTQDNS